MPKDENVWFQFRCLLMTFLMLYLIGGGPGNPGILRCVE